MKLYFCQNLGFDNIQLHKAANISILDTILPLSSTFSQTRVVNNQTIYIPLIRFSKNDPLVLFDENTSTEHHLGNRCSPHFNTA